MCKRGVGDGGPCLDNIKQAGEEEKDSATVVAENRFFQLLKQQKDDRIKLNKPLVFTDEE